MNKNSSKIFISHSHKDNEFCLKLADDLEESNINCWIDLWEMNVGDSLRRRVQEGINSSNWLGVVLSNNSVNSVWIEEELDMGFVKELEAKSVFILPLLIDECEIPLSLKGKMYADFRIDYKNGLNSLLSRLQNLSFEEKSEFRKLKRYCKKIDEQLPQFTKLFGTCLSAGLSINSSIKLLSENLLKPLSDELLIIHNSIEERDADLLEVLDLLSKKVPTKRMQLLNMLFKIGCGTGSLDQLLIEANYSEIDVGEFV